MEEQEQELKRLRRQHRILVNDKHALKGAYGMKTLHQKKLLESMREELADLNLTKMHANRIVEDRHLVARVKSLNHCYEMHQNAIQAQKKDIVEIDEQTKQIEQKINQLRKYDVYNKDEMDDGEVKVTLVKSENRLDTLTKHYCVILADNKTLRSEVMSLLKDRELFNEQYNKLIETLAMGKHQLIETMDSAKLVYDQREECLQKLNALFAKSKSLYSDHIEQMAEMKRHLDAQTQLGKFMRSKGCSRIMADLERKATAKRRAACENEQQQFDSYLRMIEELREFVGEKEINRITTIFIRRENENFALFNYVNILNGEIDALTDEILEQRKQIDQQRELKANESEHKAVTLKELREELASAQKETLNAQGELGKLENDLMEILQELEKTFQILECESSPVHHLLDDTSTVEGSKLSLQNVLTHLEIFDSKLAMLMTSTKNCNVPIGINNVVD